LTAVAVGVQAAAHPDPSPARERGRRRPFRAAEHLTAGARRVRPASRVPGAVVARRCRNQPAARRRCAWRRGRDTAPPWSTGAGDARGRRPAPLGGPGGRRGTLDQGRPARRCATRQAVGVGSAGRTVGQHRDVGPDQEVDPRRRPTPGRWETIRAQGPVRVGLGPAAGYRRRKKNRRGNAAHRRAGSCRGRTVDLPGAPAPRRVRRGPAGQRRRIRLIGQPPGRRADPCSCAPAKAGVAEQQLASLGGRREGVGGQGGNARRRPSRPGRGRQQRGPKRSPKRGGGVGRRAN